MSNSEDARLTIEVDIESPEMNHASLGVVPLGVGDAFSELYYSSGLWLEYQGASLLIDCAHPIRKSMRESSISSGCDIRAEELDGIVVTHLHSDHASGLEGLGFYSYYVINRALPLLAHADVMQDIWPQHLKGTMAPMCDLPDDQRTFQDFFVPMMLQHQQAKKFGPFTIECRRTNHHIPTDALRISAGNKTLGYSSDTSFDESLIEWLAEADMIIHETNVASHTPYEKLIGLKPAVKNKMKLIHYPDDFNKSASEIEPLEQGKLYRL